MLPLFNNVDIDINENKDKRIKFITNRQRLNVLWSRSKKHFIQIVSKSFLNSYNSVILDKNKKLLQPRMSIELGIENDKVSTNIVSFNVDNKTDLLVNNLWKTFDLNKINDSNKFSYIGKYGEEIFDNLINDPLFKNMLIKKVYDDVYNEQYSPQYKDINFSNNRWLNCLQESYETYDFKIDDKFYIDVKSSNTKSNVIWFSEREKEFAIKNHVYYLVDRINDISKFNLNIKEPGSKVFILNKINFFKLYKHKNNNDIFVSNNSKNNIIINIRGQNNN